LLRNLKTGGFEVYDISSNNITNVAFMGTVGLDWQIPGFGNFSSHGGADNILLNNKSGGRVEDQKANKQSNNAALLGTVGVNWEIAGFGNFSSNPGETDMILQYRHWRTRGLRHRQQSDHQCCLYGYGRVGLAGRRLRQFQQQSRRIRHDPAQPGHGRPG